MRDAFWSLGKLGRAVVLLLSLSLIPRAVAGSEETLAAVRDRVAHLSATEKKELERKQTRFYSLPVEDQERLRQFHRDLGNDAEADRLRGLMQRYASWLKTLSSGQRADLLSIEDPKVRIAEIKRLIGEQERSRLRSFVAHELSDEDLAAIVKWMDEYVLRHERELLAMIPSPLRQRIQQTNDPKKRQLFLFMALRPGPRRDGQPWESLRPDQEDIQRLQGLLSPSARQELEKAQKEGRLNELAQRWMRAATFRRFMPPVDRDELRKFYNEVVAKDPRNREYLESLPPERMIAELTRQFYMHRFKSFGGTNKPPGRPGGAWRGRGYHGRPSERRTPLGPPSFGRPQEDGQNAPRPNRPAKEPTKAQRPAGPA